VRGQQFGEGPRQARASDALQDQLVKELRLRGISTVEAANAWAPSFVADVWEYPDGRIELRADGAALPCTPYDRLSEIDLVERTIRIRGRPPRLRTQQPGHKILPLHRRANRCLPPSRTGDGSRCAGVASARFLMKRMCPTIQATMRLPSVPQQQVASAEAQCRALLQSRQS
jgi:hypothetical protein